MVHLFVIYRLYNTEYKFHVTPIVIVAMRYVPGNVKICKTFLNFSDPFNDFNFN